MENESSNGSGNESGGFDYGSLDATGAQKAIDGIFGNPEHAYHGKNRGSAFDSREHKAAVEHVGKLFQIKSGEFVSQPAETTTVLTTAESATEPTAADAQLNNDLRAAVQTINGIWEGADLDINEVLKDATPERLEGYQQMSLLAQGDYESLTPIIVEDATKLGMPADQVSLLEQFMSTAMAGDPLSDELVHTVIQHIHKAKIKGTKNE